MDIITFSDGLQKRASEVKPTALDDLVSMSKALNAFRELLAELKMFTLTYSFENEKEEIQFFKEVKPVLLSQYYYYKKMFDLMLFDSFRDNNSRIDNYRLFLQKLQRFALKNHSFFEYCMAGATHLDNQYFIRSKRASTRINRDEKFSTCFDIKLAKIMAHELIKDFVLNSIRKLECTKDRRVRGLEWTTSKVALVELIYALSAAGAINNGKSDIKQLANGFEEMFSIELKDYARIFSELRIRKKGQTNFIDQLKDRLQNLVREME
jgi:hypothetical protein